MDIGLDILSSITVHNKYARFLPELQRRETWQEIVNRYEKMMIGKFPYLHEEIKSNSRYIHEKKVLPSMRMLQFAGEALEVNNARGFNCAYMPIDSIHAFSETMFLLLGGTGVGYSVQRQHVAKLPSITIPSSGKRYLIQDSIMGWADAIKMLMKAYLQGASFPEFDFRDIRAKGTPLKTAGGKAPGPGPLRECLEQIQLILERKDEGDKLTPLECHDIICHVSNSVLAGGIRRAACICLFSDDDHEMLTCKCGNWWESNEQRGRANNSVVLNRKKTTIETFNRIWFQIMDSGSGEPGIYWTNNDKYGTNPCAEIALRPFCFCNLCEINGDNIDSQEELEKRTKVAAFFGTLQASFTDFHYLRPVWKRTSERDALLGIGMTGIASGRVLGLDLTKAAEVAVNINKKLADYIGINQAARVTCIKPSGTTSCVLATSSGIHAWHDHYYLRTIRFSKNEDIASYLIVNHPEICEDDEIRPHDTLCVRIPIKAPEGAILRTEPPIDTLKRVKKFSDEWIKPGHIDGDNMHNVSATISIKDDEWETIGEWMWNNREYYNGISVLPYNGGTYKQAPFESITKEEYESRLRQLQKIDLRNVHEIENHVDFGQVVACSGNACEIT